MKKNIIIAMILASHICLEANASNIREHTTDYDHPQYKLMSAAKSDGSKIRQCIDQGASINYRGAEENDPYGYRSNFTPFLYAVMNNNTVSAQILLDLDPRLINGTTIPTPLQVAICWKKPNMVCFLLNKGANINDINVRLPSQYVTSGADMAAGAIIGSVFLPVVGTLIGAAANMSKGRSALDFALSEKNQASQIFSEEGKGSENLEKWQSILDALDNKKMGRPITYSLQESDSKCVIS